MALPASGDEGRRGDLASAQLGQTGRAQGRARVGRSNCGQRRDARRGVSVDARLEPRTAPLPPLRRHAHGAWSTAAGVQKMEAPSPWSAEEAPSPWSAEEAPSPWSAEEALSPWSAEEALSPWSAEGHVRGPCRAAVATLATWHLRRRYASSAPRTYTRPSPQLCSCAHPLARPATEAQLSVRHVTPM
eukprot:6696582-Prymnesium_polylepis.1